MNAYRINSIIQDALAKYIKRPTNGRDVEELCDDALCLAWEVFRNHLPTAESAEQAAKSAAWIAAKRVTGKRYRGFLGETKDPLDNAKHLDTWDCVQPEKLEPVSQDWSIPLTDKLRPIAEMIVAGFGPQPIADRLGIDRATYYRRRSELRKLAAAHCNRCACCGRHSPNGRHCSACVDHAANYVSKFS